MTKIKNHLELYKHLDQSNCKRCMLPSCMAFAVAVIQNQKTLDDCPALELELKQQLSGDVVKKPSFEEEQEQMLNTFKDQITKIDLGAAAERLGAPMKNGMIAISCLGKDFLINPGGEMVSECHKNVWVQVPVLQYIIGSKGVQPKGEWVAFGQLAGAADWQRFFSHRCESEMKKLVDAHTDLMFEILHLFGATPISGITNADQSLVIKPLPKVPFLINYWLPEDGFESKLTMLFDRTAEANINIESLYTLGAGLVEMFRKLIVKHNKDGKLFES